MGLRVYSSGSGHGLLVVSYVETKRVYRVSFVARRNVAGDLRMVCNVYHTK